ncbi:XdhC family protein [Changchengzhania lutea]|uniref:XdhC family protein n=1 Tax=Changchengzhania lutea TaxID=2049305 RepID=UPI00115CA1F8|nr:XdhC/CoxI family protein [Changchengzhania lutea]
MTHEFKNIVNEAQNAAKKGVKSVLASVVALDGSSYRRPGVRMLILENGSMIGAVSGGCVEKEILLQSESVFSSGVSKIMTYDGRYRLGCEGVLYILLEEFAPDEAFYDTFQNCLTQRHVFRLQSFCYKKTGIFKTIGTQVLINNKLYKLSKFEISEAQKEHAVFEQLMTPCFKLLIIGAEHDAVQLCQFAALTGWEVTIISGVSESKSISDFPGASGFQTVSAESLDVKSIDNQTAIILMTHNFAIDLRYLVTIRETNPCYIGLLGPKRRRADLLSQFIEYCPDIDEAFLERIHGPAGINIGAVTPQEIAISIIAEILSVIREQEPMPLNRKAGSIHA